MPINRRQFMAAASLAGGSLLVEPVLSPLKLAVPIDFSLTILATNWGFPGELETFCAKAREAGYDGIEVWTPASSDQAARLSAALAQYDLKLGLLAGSGSSDYSEHAEQFQERLEAAVALNPLFVNCHSGRDYFTFEQNKALIDFTTRLAKTSGVPIYHETHRARILFAAHIAQQYLEAMPDLRLTLDISHWCNVHSSLLEDQPAAVDLALSRTDHVHARIGHANSPQVTDPRAPEVATAVQAHFSWWDQVVAQKVSAGSGLTMTTEFGPPSYMATVPFTNQPLADQWDVNVYMMKLWRERYQN